MDTGVIVLVVLVLTALVLWRQSRRQVAQTLAARARLLEPCLPLFEGAVVRPASLGYPRLSGRAMGRIWDVQVVPDGLGVRKLPALWLLVSVTEPMPVAGTLHLMLRPTGAEGFSNFRRLPDQGALPEGFPQDAGLRGEGVAGVSPALMLPVVAALGEARVKEVIISPKGLRVTLLLDEAERGKYLILRQVDLGRAPVEPALMRAALAALDDLAARLGAEDVKGAA